MATGPEAATTDRLSKGERTRQAILEAAIRQIAAVGLRSTSIPAIARDVGVTPSAIYSHFPTKQRLFDEAVDTDVAALMAEAVPDILAGTFDNDFGSVFGRLFAALEHHQLARRVLAGEERGGAERLPILAAEMRLFDGLATALRSGQANGTVRPDVDADLLAVGLESIVIALLIAVLQIGDTVDPGYSLGSLAVLDAAIRPATPPHP